MTDIIEFLAVCGLIFWTVYSWGGGRLLLRELKESINLHYLADGAMVILGVSGNILNIIYELGHFILGWPTFRLHLPNSLRWMGILLFILGCAWVTWSKRTLGTAWTVLPQFPIEGIRTRGPYAIVRHPIYVGAVVLYTGLLLGQSNAIGSFIFGAQIVGFIMKTSREDRFLSSRLSEYTAYKKNVRWKLVPGLW